jgi:ferrochelatase
LNATDKNSVAVLLLNTGSPYSPGYFHVVSYLARFLGERRVIGLPWLFRKILVNAGIAPFRAFRSSQRYRKLYSLYNGQFPLMKYGENNKQQLQGLLSGEATVFFATAYGRPSIREVTDEICKDGFCEVLLLPLYPQYASSSTGVVLEKAIKGLKRKKELQINSVTSFYRNGLFIGALAERIAFHRPDSYDYILFCYHSLPLKHIEAVRDTEHCYVTACNETTRLIADKLNLTEGRYGTAYQSRLSGCWQAPFVKKQVIEKARAGCRKLLLVAPSFVADCLETMLELGIEYRNLFLENGGEELKVVESLNAHPEWIRCLENLCRDELQDRQRKFTIQ